MLLFHTEEPSQQFYSDGFDEDGVYWYSGEGTSGDMSWSWANRAIRDHEENGTDLYLFERAQRADGLWCFQHLMQYIGHRREMHPDKEGNQRNAIIFALMSLDSEKEPFRFLEGLALTELREKAKTAGSDAAVTLSTRIQAVRLRSAAVRFYAMQRADGICEACNDKAPFVAINGEPFLEVHHIIRLSDSGPDRIDRVAAICPNCHRRSHYGIDRVDYNLHLKERVLAIETQLDSKATRMKQFC